MTDSPRLSARTRWARFRFRVVALLLSAPPESGELRKSLENLASRSWGHPTTGEALRLGAKTNERRYYIAPTYTSWTEASENEWSMATCQVVWCATATTSCC